MKTALYFEKHEKGVHCTLCPHYCVLRENEKGFCGARRNLGGTLYSVNYGKITAVHVDPIEKKPLRHFMPGTYTLSFGSFGCNMGCPFCQNHEISKGAPDTAEFSSGKLVSLALEKNVPSISYTYNEPTVFYEFMLETAKRARDKGLKNIAVTNGFINAKPLNELLQVIDAMNIDLKAFDEKTYRDVLKGSLKDVLRTIETAAQRCHVEVTMLLVPGVCADLETVEKAAQHLASIDKTIPLHLSRYFPRYKFTEPETSAEFALKAAEAARNHLQHVYTGNL